MDWVTASVSAAGQTGIGAVTGSAAIRRFLDENMYRFDLPVQYLGDEPNAVRRPFDEASVRWCLVAAWPYEQAAGNSSIPAVYRAINDADPEFLADRFYLPATPRDLRTFERAGLPIFGIESKHPLLDFDVVGTSISYPVLSMSYIKMVAMSGIPVRWRDRDQAGSGQYPMLIAGGLSYGAPEVLAPVVDCWWLGEVEDEPGNPGITDVCRRIQWFKSSGQWLSDRIGCYTELAREFAFLYFPRFITVEYDYEDRSHVGVGPHPSKQVVGYSSTVEGMRLPRTKRYVKDLDAAAPLTSPPLLYADPAMGAGDLEVGRGCPAWCSFCALTYRAKPYRQRSVASTVEYAREMQANLGSVRLTPVAPDFPMHTQRSALVAALLEQVSDEVDASTMRVDDFIADPRFIRLQVAAGMDTVTLGVEGNSQRMRDLIGKGTADGDIKEAVTRGIAAGVRKFKLFMISGLPGEDEGDTYRILRLARDLADIRESLAQPHIRIQFSWTPLLIEANTPMQWFAVGGQNRLLADIFEELRELNIDFKLGAKAEPNKAAFFQLCQRASRDVGEALVDAMVEADQACWGGVPRTFKDRLEQWLHHWGFANGYADCFDERDKSDMFGWEFIDQGISNELLWTTYVQMREFCEQTDSATYDRNFDSGYHGTEWVERCDTTCQGKTCGACDHKDLRIRTNYIRAAQSERNVQLSTLTPVDQRSQVTRVRVRVHRPAEYRFVGNDHWRFALRRAAYRAQTDLGTPASIAKRSIRFASDAVKHRDWTAGVDYAEFALTRDVGADDVTQLLAAANQHLAGRMQLTEFTMPGRSARTIYADAGARLIDLELDRDPTVVAARLTAWRRATAVPMRLAVVGGYFAASTEDVNAKDHVDDLWLIRDRHRLILRMLVHGRPSPYNIAAALLAQPSWLDLANHPAHRRDVFLREDPRDGDDPLRPACLRCGQPVPVNLLGQPHHPEHCPHCLDHYTGGLVESDVYA